MSTFDFNYVEVKIYILTMYEYIYIMYFFVSRVLGFTLLFKFRVSDSNLSVQLNMLFSGTFSDISF